MVIAVSCISTCPPLQLPRRRQWLTLRRASRAEPRKTRLLHVFEYSLQDVDELRNYIAIGSTATSSYLGQVILLQRECVDHIVNAWRGDRLIATELCLAGSKHRIVIASCHVPHSDNDEDTFHEALRDVIQLFIDYKHLPIVLLGDLNCPPGSERTVALEAAILARRGKILKSGCPTRFGRWSAAELDYVCYNQQFCDLLLPEPGSLELQAHTDTHKELGSDHCCVSLFAALRDSSASVSMPSGRRRRHRLSRCRRWTVDSDRLASALHECAPDFACKDLQGQWESLKELASRSSAPKTSLRYHDSPTLKALCRTRRMSTDSSEKAALTRHIVALRYSQRAAWLQQLHDRCRMGDCDAIKYLKQRLSSPKGSTHAYIKQHGGVQQAADDLQQHYATLFNPANPPEDQQIVDRATHLFSERALTSPSPDFSEEEVGQAISRLKASRTSGVSGISNEYLVAMWGNPEGRPLLIRHLSALLHAESLPKGLLAAQVALIPKVREISKPSDYRPINLLECIHRLFSWLLICRLTPSWRLPKVQMGGIKGCQVADALLAAQSRVTRHSRSL